MTGMSAFLKRTVLVFLVLTGGVAPRPAASAAEPQPQPQSQPASDAGSAAAADSFRTVLFVDDHEVLYRPGTRRVLRPADPHSGNPVLGDEKPWERTVAYNTVHRDSVTGRYQMWYQAYGGALGTCVCYATSDDGIRWTKPMLDLYPIDGEPTNIVLTGRGHYGASVLFDPRSDDPARRYKMAFWEHPEGKTYGLGVAFSPDGVHWSKHPGTPLLEAFPGVCHTISDVIDVMFDAPRNRFAIYGKTWIDGPDGKQWKRAIIRSESLDFVEWSEPRLVMAPDEDDGWEGDSLEIEWSPVGGGSKGVQLHGGPVFFRHGVYFSLVQKMDARLTGRMPIELALSRDGLHWDRPFRRDPFIATPDRDGFGSLVWSNSTPIILDDSIRFYYGAYSGRWSGGRANFLSKPTGVGMATLPLDRFAGLRPIDRIGQVTLRPASMAPAAGLRVNGDAGDGAIRVELMDARARTIPEYSKENADPIRGDSLRHPVTWRDGAGADLPAGDYTIRLHLEGDAAVYSVGYASR